MKNMIWIVLALLLSASAFGLIIGHDSPELTSAQLSSAAGKRVLLRHASIGQNIDSGLDQLQSQDSRYDRSRIVLQSRGNPGWEQKISDLIEQADDYASQYDVLTMKFCYVDSSASWTEYRDAMLQLESEHPDKTFIWWTIPTKRDSQPAIEAFNNQARAFASANNKLLFDIADIESHHADGSACEADGVESMCPEWTDDGGHLNPSGSLRVAKAFWSAVAADGNEDGGEEEEEEDPSAVNGEIIEQVLDSEGNGYSILRVWGTYHEMGFAQGYVMAEEFMEDLVTMRDAAPPNTGSAMAATVIPQDMSDEIDGMVLGIKEALPDADVDREDIILLNSYTDWSYSPACRTHSAWGSYVTSPVKTLTTRRIDYPASRVSQIVSKVNTVLIARDPSSGVRWVSFGHPGSVTAETAVNEFGTLVSIHTSPTSHSAHASGGDVITRSAATQLMIASGDLPSDISQHLDHITGKLQSYRPWTGGFLNYIVPEGNAGVYTFSATAPHFQVRTPQASYHDGEMIATANEYTDGTSRPSDFSASIDTYYDDPQPKTIQDHWATLDSVNENDGAQQVSIAYRNREDMTIWFRGRITATRATPVVKLEWQELYDASGTGCSDADDDGYSIEGGSCGQLDCDDSNPQINPGVDEICDNDIDENCNGSPVDECDGGSLDPVATVKIVPEVASVSSGEEFTMSVASEQVMDLRSFSIQVTFDPEVVGLIEVLPGMMTDGWAAEIGDGTVTFAAEGNTTETSGDLAILRFNALQGMTDITISSIALRDADSEIETMVIDGRVLIDQDLDTCADLGGFVCSPEQTCDEDFLVTSDSIRCCPAACSGGTGSCIEGECMPGQPLRCIDGKPVHDCETCGCKTGECQPDGKCNSGGGGGCSRGGSNGGGCTKGNSKDVSLAFVFLLGGIPALRKLRR